MVPYNLQHFIKLCLFSNFVLVIRAQDRNSFLLELFDLLSLHSLLVEGLGGRELFQGRFLAIVPLLGVGVVELEVAAAATLSHLILQFCVTDSFGPSFHLVLELGSLESYLSLFDQVFDVIIVEVFKALLDSVLLLFSLSFQTCQLRFDHLAAKVPNFSCRALEVHRVARAS